MKRILAAVFIIQGKEYCRAEYFREIEDEERKRNLFRVVKQLVWKIRDVVGELFEGQ